MTPEAYPLSSSQQAIYLDSLLHPPTAKYNMGGAFVIRGPFDLSLFRQALEFAARRHDAERIRLRLEGETALQEFLPDILCELQVLDFSGKAQPFQSAIEWMSEDISHPIPLESFPLFGDLLFRLSENLHLWYPKFHHIANDAFGHSLIAATISAAYTELAGGGRLPEIDKRSYVDFIEDDSRYRASDRFLEDAAYWREKFASMPEPLPFTARKNVLPGDLLKSVRCTLGVSRLVYDAVLKACERDGVTPFQLLLAAMFAYLHRTTGRPDIVIGTPILNRSNNAFRNTAGMFMNMMPLRMTIPSDATLFSLAKEIRAELRQSYRRQRFPLAEIVRHCRTLDGFCHAVYDVMLVYRKLGYDLDFAGSPVRVVTLDCAEYDETLVLQIDEYNEVEDVNFFFNYSPRLISEAEAEQMARAFEAMLIDTAVGSDVRIRDIRLLTENPRPPRVVAEPQGQQTVVGRFQELAAAAPHALAVICGDERLSYRELDEASNRVAAFLRRECELEDEQPVAVLSDRNAPWVTAVVGIFKAGGAYLPLDPEAPRERIEFILRDSGCRVLLVDERNATASFDGLRIVRLSHVLQTIARAEFTVRLTPRSLAYILFTSGTTGQPKGSLVEHAGMSNTAFEVVRQWAITPQDRVLQFASPMFDASIAEVAFALVSGAALVIAPREVTLDPPQLLELLRREHVTVAAFPPAYLSALERADLSPLRVLATAGESANPSDVAHYSRKLAYANLYGPTETSICVTIFNLAPGDSCPGDRIPIGKPLAHTEVYILDEDLRPMPVGAEGEIYVAGVNLGRGYLSRPDLTAERFISNPFREGERMYRTGDLGRLLPDGNIEYLGRRDTQVKIRGCRVELGEIESVLKLHPAVADAAVAAVDGELLAYVVARGDVRCDELRGFLARKLPAYMMPNQWFSLPAMPVNISGKIDRPKLLGSGQAMLGTAPEGTAPRTELERSVARIWEELLETGPIHVEDDFFALGGHSLKAVQAISRIQNRLGARVELRQFFANPVLSALVGLIETSRRCTEEPILPAPKSDLYPLSNSQVRIWILSQMEGGSVAYNMPLPMALEGELDVSALERSFRAVIERHESLRTCFVAEDGWPRQRVLPPSEVGFNLDQEDLTGLTSPSAAVQERLTAEIMRPFDFSRAPLLRTRLLRTAQRRWVLSLVVHHIVGDGWSLKILLQELLRHYENILVEDRPCQLAPLRIQYKDYSHWFARQLEEAPARADRAFWLEKLAQPLPVLDLPADRPRPPVMGFAGSPKRFALPRTSAAPLAAFCARRGVSAFMVLTAGVFGLLHRYTGNEDIIIGTPVAGRGRLDLEDQIGVYINTLALRSRVDRDITLEELLTRIGSTILEAQEHQAYPFDSLVRDLNVPRRTDRNALFDVMVVMQDTIESEFHVRGLKGEEYSPVPVHFSMFDLTTHFSQAGGNWRVDVEYSTGLFEPERMERFAQHLDCLISAIVANPTLKLRDLDLLGQEERRQLLEVFAQGPLLPAPAETVIDRFTEQASRAPDRAAVACGARKVTYRELAGMAGAVAAGIREHVASPQGAVVALVAGPSERTPAGVIGIMASGAACLPIDAEMPLERVRYLIEDSGCLAVVTDDALAIGTSLPLLRIPESAQPDANPLESFARLCDPAYVAYTSGSTGSPKASLIEHRSLANLMAALDGPLYSLLPTPGEELLLASIGFDVALKQIFGALTRGHTLVMAEAALKYDPAAFMRTVVERGVHLVDLTPTHFSVLLAQGFAHLPKPDLKAIVLGSEPAAAALVERFYRDVENRHIKLLNFYGPSECTVETLCCSLDHSGVDPGVNGIAPIGRPLANTRAYVLSRDLRPVPIGVAGEICLGGASVGRGYMNRPELTAARFVESPFHAGERLYRTGDLGRWNEKGMLEFLGREDDQLKIRGYRVEPGEVEHQLRRHPLVTGAVAAGRVGPSGNLELAAWYTAAAPAPAAESLREHLRRFLPEYMVPARLVAVGSFPIGLNGKIVKDALPDPWAAPGGTAPVRAPDNPVESEICAIWRQVLGVEIVGTDVNFFDLGGNSLLLAQLHSLIEGRHSGAIKLIELFSAATVQAQARLIVERAAPARLEQAATPAVAILKPAPSEDDGRVAIIGIGLRIGSSQDLDSLWKELAAGRDFVRPLPETRLRAAEQLAKALGMSLDEARTPEMAYLDEIDKFDCAHFGIPPLKAAWLDPREKMFLETAWHAIEDAGYGGSRLRGTRTGVFLGESTGSGDFSRLLEAAGVADANQILESLTPSMTASRVSHVLDLRGPALLADTACSSSLMALCLAVEALRSGRCDLALAGSVKLYLLPFRRGGRSEIESPDGRTRSFDDEAAGTGGGEASLALLLKPLARALEDGDPIHAVVRGVASNQDGAAAGITAPNANAQAEVIQQAWKDAAIDPEQLAFIEAHGTGTRLGDPVEVEGLTKAFQPYTQRRQFCALGSIKASLGHTDHAAGLAGVLRAVLSLKHRQVPPVVHFQKPNQHIRFEESPLFVNAELISLEHIRSSLLCGVSSFGLSGTNVHVVLEEAPHRAAGVGGSQLWLAPLSARTTSLLQEYAASLRAYLEQHREIALKDVAFTLATGRRHLGARAAILCRSRADLTGKLALLSATPENRPESGLFFGLHKAAAAAKLVRAGTDVAEDAVAPDRGATQGRGDKADAGSLAELAQSYVQGADVDWLRLFPDDKPRRCSLPGTPFERTRCWPRLRQPGFSLLGRLKAETPETFIFEAEWQQDSHWLLAEHRVANAVVLVGSAYLELARQVAQRIWNTDKLEIVRLSLAAPLALGAEEERRVVVSVATKKTNLSVTVYSVSSANDWQSHAVAELARLDSREEVRLDLDRLSALPAYGGDLRGSPGTDIQVGPHWNCLRAVRHDGPVWAADVAVPEEHWPDAAEFGLYPPLLDAALNFAAGDTAQFPWWLEGVRIYGALPRQAVVESRELGGDERSTRLEVKVAAPDGRVVMAVREYTLRARGSARRLGGFFHQVVWGPAPTVSVQPESGVTIVAPDCGCAADAQLAQAAGASTRLRSESEWSTWLAGQDAGVQLEIAFLLPACSGVGEISGTRIDAMVESSLGRLFSLSSLLAQRRAKARVLVVGNLAHEVTGSEPSLNPLHAAAAGFARAPALETSGFQCRFLDLDGPPTGDLVLREFAAAFASSDHIVAWREGRRYVSRIEALDIESAPERLFAVRAGATYLITGGVGGMGLEIARWLAGRAPVRLVLAGRTPFPARDQWDSLAEQSAELWIKTRALQEIESLGAELHLVSADAANVDDVARIRREFPGVRGIFHCAGIGVEGFLKGQQWDRLIGVLRPKIHGTVALREVFGTEPLDAFVLAGSITAFTGAPGQAGYTAANAFQDGEARRLRHQGVPALCINWTAWKETGMAKAAGRVADDVFRAIATRDAMLCLDALLHKDVAHALVGEAAPVRVSSGTAKPTERAEQPSAGSAGLSQTRVALKGRDDGEYTPTERLIGQYWSDALGYNELDIRADFDSLGGDSITSISLLERILSETPHRPSLPDLDRYPTIESLAAFLDQQQFVVQRSEADHRERLVYLGGGGARKLFCFPPGSASCYRYYDLVRRLPDSDVYGLNYFRSAAPAAQMADMLVQCRPAGDFTLLGYSIGGNLAYEVALELLSQGRQVRGLVLIDSWRRLELFHFTDQEYRKNMEEFLSAADPRYLAMADRETLLQRVEAYDRYMDSRMEDRPVPFPIRLIRAGSGEIASPFRITQEGWKELTPDFRLLTGSGPHLEMLDMPHVVRNAELVAGVLEELAVGLQSAFLRSVGPTRI
jgi:amino acid adenylation domain-containing protein